MVSRMEEREARLRLLEDELGALHAGISAYDGRITQIKGWCVTVASGLLALALTQERPALALGALVAVLSFWLTDSHNASIQQVMMNRHEEIELHFRRRSVIAALDDERFDVLRMARAFDDPEDVKDHWFKQVKYELGQTLSQAVVPYRLFFYVLVLLSVSIVALAGSIL